MAGPTLPSSSNDADVCQSRMVTFYVYGAVMHTLQDVGQRTGPPKMHFITINLGLKVLNYFSKTN